MLQKGGPLQAQICDMLPFMRRPSILIASMVALAAMAIAQDEAEYKTWMKSVSPSVGTIRSAADNAAAADSATKLADTFDKVATFWKARNADDAVKLAETARDAAKAIASGSGDKAANLQTIQRTCGACHMAHRAGSAPNFTIK
jgi:mono/diheme cytochrome c family protein